MVGNTRVPLLRSLCLNFVILSLRTLQILYVCYENNKSPFESGFKFESNSPFTIIAKLCFTSNKLYFVNDEVRAGCPKLGHTILFLNYKKLFPTIVQLMQLKYLFKRGGGGGASLTGRKGRECGWEKS